MRKLFFIVGLLLFSFGKNFGQATDAPILVKQGMDLIAAKNEEAALEKFKAALKSDPNNYEAACKASLLCSKIGNRQTDINKKKEYFVLAKQYAVKSLKIKPDDAESNYVMAVAMGRIALIAGTKDKVAASRDIKKYVDMALKYNPEHAGAWHVLGKWNYEMSNLNIAEIAVAKTLFGGVPPGATKDEAIRCYKKAIELDPTYILYRLDLAAAYNSIAMKEEAINTLKKAVELPPRTEDDPRYIKKGKEMLLEIESKK